MRLPNLPSQTYLNISIAFASCLPLAVSCKGQSNERHDAMVQMHNLVGILHGVVHDLRKQPGFPKADVHAENGIATCSWRLAILNFQVTGPYVNLNWKSPFNQAQDTSTNRRLFAVQSLSQPSQFAQVFALVGNGTAFTEYEEGRGRETGDAEPDAILLMDSKNELIHWMEPGDIDVRPLAGSDIPGMAFNDLKPNYPEGFLIAFVDGAVWLIRKDVPHNVISPFFTLEGARTHDRDADLAPYALDKVAPLTKQEGRYSFQPTETIHHF